MSGACRSMDLRILENLADVDLGGTVDAADAHGNVVYNKTARNFAPIMAMASDVAIVQVEQSLEAGALDPEVVVTPGIFVNRVVEVAEPAHESQLVAAGVSYP